MTFLFRSHVLRNDTVLYFCSSFLSLLVWFSLSQSQCDKQLPHQNTKNLVTTEIIFWIFCEMQLSAKWSSGFSDLPPNLPLNVPHHFTLSVLGLSAWPCTSFWHSVKWGRIPASEQIGNNTTLGLQDEWWARVVPRAWTLIHILSYQSYDTL